VLEGDLEWVAGVPSRPALYAYLPPRERANGGAVLVCPGGGYAGQAFRKEGIEAADWFCARGVAAFVLLYRSGPPASRAPGPWEDAQRAIRLIRSRAAEWRVDPAKTGVVGFSAGGHLASSLATRFAAADAAAADPLERFSGRPDFAVLVYPVISLRYATHAGSRLNLLGPAPSEEAVRTWSTDEQVTADTPPTFLVHASDDASVLPQNSLLFYQALLQRRVPAALHVYERGGHGFGMLRGDAPQDRWPELLEPWLRARGVVR
jgi:acetyl esterase/lipase